MKLFREDGAKIDIDTFARFCKPRLKREKVNDGNLIHFFARKKWLHGGGIESVQPGGGGNEDRVYYAAAGAAPLGTTSRLL